MVETSKESRNRWDSIEGDFQYLKQIELRATGGLPLSFSDSSLQLRLGELRVPVTLENLRPLASLDGPASGFWCTFGLELSCLGNLSIQ